MLTQTFFLLSPILQLFLFRPVLLPLLLVILTTFSKASETNSALKSEENVNVALKLTNTTYDTISKSNETEQNNIIEKLPDSSKDEKLGKKETTTISNQSDLANIEKHLTNLPDSSEKEKPGEKETKPKSNQSELNINDKHFPDFPGPGKKETTSQPNQTDDKLPESKESKEGNNSSYHTAAKSETVSERKKENVSKVVEKKLEEEIVALELVKNSEQTDKDDKNTEREIETSEERPNKTMRVNTTVLSSLNATPKENIPSPNNSPGMKNETIITTADNNNNNSTHYEKLAFTSLNGTLVNVNSTLLRQQQRKRNRLLHAKRQQLRRRPNGPWRHQQRLLNGTLPNGIKKMPSLQQQQQQQQVKVDPMEDEDQNLLDFVLAQLASIHLGGNINYNESEFKDFIVLEDIQHLLPTNLKSNETKTPEMLEKEKKMKAEILENVRKKRLLVHQLPERPKVDSLTDYYNINPYSPYIDATGQLVPGQDYFYNQEPQGQGQYYIPTYDTSGDSSGGYDVLQQQEETSGLYYSDLEKIKANKDHGKVHEPKVKAHSLPARPVSKELPPLEPVYYDDYPYDQYDVAQYDGANYPDYTYGQDPNVYGADPYVYNSNPDVYNYGTSGFTQDGQPIPQQELPVYDYQDGSYIPNQHQYYVSSTVAPVPVDGSQQILYDQNYVSSPQPPGLYDQSLLLTPGFEAIDPGFGNFPQEPSGSVSYQYQTIPKDPQVTGKHNPNYISTTPKPKIKDVSFLPPTPVLVDQLVEVKQLPPAPQPSYATTPGSNTISIVTPVANLPR